MIRCTRAHVCSAAELRLRMTWTLALISRSRSEWPFHLTTHSLSLLLSFRFQTQKPNKQTQRHFCPNFREEQTPNQKKKKKKKEKEIGNLSPSSSFHLLRRFFSVGLIDIAGFDQWRCVFNACGFFFFAVLVDFVRLWEVLFDLNFFFGWIWWNVDGAVRLRSCFWWDWSQRMTTRNAEPAQVSFTGPSMLDRSLCVYNYI